MKILTFDSEEWFHILDNKETKGESDWKNFESRIHNNMDTIFEIVEKSNTKATFFVVGWIAKQYPEVVREIVRRGFEVGSHTHLHQLAYEQNHQTFYSDVEKSIKILEWPGLWNGGMAEWNSIFVEVPKETFNPVKSIIDLLR